MAYRSVAQVAEDWGVSQRHVQGYCRAGRIPGAQRFGKSWAIPADVEKPLDPRLPRWQPDDNASSIARDISLARPVDELALYQKETPRYGPFSLLCSRPLPSCELDAAIERFPLPERAQYRAEVNYLRGRFRDIKDYYRTVNPDQTTFIAACATTLGASASTGDLKLFAEAESALNRISQTSAHSQDRLCAEAARTIATVSMFDAENLPRWLKEADFSLFPLDSLPALMYLQVKFLQGQRRHDAMLEAARTALLFCSKKETITSLDIYFRTSCAAACYALGDYEACKKWLREALTWGLPWGFTAPFTETIMMYGGLLEQCLQELWPGYYDRIVLVPEESWRHWIAFHNRFAKDNITLVLSKQEYRLAQYLVGGDTYAQAARRMQLSLGRVKNIVSVIYGKLHITGRKELEQFVA